MAIDIKTWEIKDDKLNLIENTLEEEGRKEKDHLEKWLKTNPEIFGNEIQIIGEQIQTKSGPLDFLGIDNNGNTVIIELKRGKLPREVLAQAIDYASDIAKWEIDRLSEVCMGYNKMSLEDLLTENFKELDLEEISININQRILLVGFGIEESLSRMIEWLSNQFDVSINAIILKYIKTTGNEELLSRTVIIPEEVEKAKSEKKKFKIAMSDEPGKYEIEELKKLLKTYLTKNLHSARRIKDVILPALLNKERLNRKELLKEFVVYGEAESESQAGYFMALISTQLGHEWKDYLRQVIEYGYPNNTWEKDNFKIREGYKEIVQDVLDELK